MSASSASSPSSHSFPYIPVAFLAVVLLMVLFVIVVPPVLKERRLAMEGKHPVWWGYMFNGRCLIDVTALHPDSSEMEMYKGEIPSGSLVAQVRLDNSRGRREVALDLHYYRFLMFSGRGVNSLDLAKSHSQPDIVLRPGSVAVVYVVAFRSDELLPSFDSLCALRMKINGEVFNLPGRVYYDINEMEELREDYRGRVKSFPTPEYH